MHKYLTIIPARKNSKRLKNKNLINFFNKPLISFTFNFVNKIKKFDYILLSTDDQKILKIAKKYKINAPFKRPKSLSGDKVNLNRVIIHSINWYKKKYKSLPENIVLLQPTSPLRDTKEFKRIISLYEKKKYNSLLTVSKPMQDQKDMFFFKKKIAKASKQNAKRIFFIDGSLYMCKYSFFKKYKTITNEKSSICYVDQKNSFDINNKFELNLAKSYYLYNKMYRKKNNG
tara:strand:- start:595 stop:1284 length:690 start_codon:yes stop_codon:yes gene_type:complete